jgi:hypothetical protein
MLYDAAVVDEKVGLTVTADKAEATLRIKPLNYTVLLEITRQVLIPQVMIQDIT